MYKLGWYQFVPFMVTIIGILLTDLLVGIGLGMGVAVFFLLLTNYRNPYLVDDRPHKPGETVRLTLSEDVSFLNRATIMRTLDAIPPGTKVEIDATRSVNIDYDVYEILGTSSSAPGCSTSNSRCGGSTRCARTTTRCGVSVG